MCSLTELLFSRHDCLPRSGARWPSCSFSDMIDCLLNVLTDRAALFQTWLLASFRCSLTELLFSRHDWLPPQCARWLSCSFPDMIACLVQVLADRAALFLTWLIASFRCSLIELLFSWYDCLPPPGARWLSCSFSDMIAYLVQVLADWAAIFSTWLLASSWCSLTGLLFSRHDCLPPPGARWLSWSFSDMIACLVQVLADWAALFPTWLIASFRCSLTELLFFWHDWLPPQCARWLSCSFPDMIDCLVQVLADRAALFLTWLIASSMCSLTELLFFRHDCLPRSGARWLSCSFPDMIACLVQVLADRAALFLTWLIASSMCSLIELLFFRHDCLPRSGARWLSCSFPDMIDCLVQVLADRAALFPTWLIASSMCSLTELLFSRHDCLPRSGARWLSCSFPDMIACLLKVLADLAALFLTWLLTSFNARWLSCSFFDMIACLLQVLTDWAALFPTWLLASSRCSLTELIFFWHDCLPHSGARWLSCYFLDMIACLIQVLTDWAALFLTWLVASSRCSLTELLFFRHDCLPRSGARWLSCSFSDMIACLVQVLADWAALFPTWLLASFRCSLTELLFSRHDCLPHSGARWLSCSFPDMIACLLQVLADLAALFLTWLLTSFRCSLTELLLFRHDCLPPPGAHWLGCSFPDMIACLLQVLADWADLFLTWLLASFRCSLTELLFSRHDCLPHSGARWLSCFFRDMIACLLQVLTEWAALFPTWLLASSRCSLTELIFFWHDCLPHSGARWLSCYFLDMIACLIQVLTDWAALFLTWLVASSRCSLTELLFFRHDCLPRSGARWLSCSFSDMIACLVQVLADWAALFPTWLLASFRCSLTELLFSRHDCLPRSGARWLSCSFLDMIACLLQVLADLAALFLTWLLTSFRCSLTELLFFRHDCLPPPGAHWLGCSFPDMIACLLQVLADWADLFLTWLLASFRCSLTELLFSRHDCLPHSGARWLSCFFRDMIACLLQVLTDWAALFPTWLLASSRCSLTEMLFFRHDCLPPPGARWLSHLSRHRSEIAMVYMPSLVNRPLM